MSLQVLYATDTGTILQWQDTALHNYAPCASGAAVLPVTAQEWADAGSYGRVVSGVLQAASADNAVVVPLKMQAPAAQVWIQQQANLASAMGEVFTADMKAYVKAISAIASGADTTSTVLPAQPVDVTTSTA